MYLKSIEIHGFKSFANKILFEFHDGITAIVGPNGSGKSNVADAVRWVLGEQSAKQLRGANMQDVIFSGSEARKPLGYAFVEITFDNCDHKLPIAYEEVSVARRVYRSGESEYLINGMTCRLRDVQELFMDTGIGKEGYSIIGQGQIDRILSTKPEDRRELFDEAAGIVKFKKRKEVAEKNLADANLNLERIIDIIDELEKQIGPLEEQSVTAREYLRLKESLKRLELNSFLNDYEKSDSQRKLLEQKYEAACGDLEDTKLAGTNAEAEFHRLESQLEDYDKALEEGRSFRSDLMLSIEKREGEIKLFEQQLLAINQNSERIDERVAAILREISVREQELTGFDRQKKEYDDKLKALTDLITDASDRFNGIKHEMDELTKSIEDANADVIRLINDSTSVKTETQRYETMLEQISLRREELSKKLVFNASLREEAENEASALESRLAETDARIDEANSKLNELIDGLRTADEEGHRLAAVYEGTQQKYLGAKSRAESLRNIAERYEGYGSAVKKVMEEKESFGGIDGVVADLITVDRKYETAVETALGASIQHIVTEDEQTAKKAIEFLKTNKFGRATFLPISSVKGNRGDNPKEAFTEKGVIGDAASLVTADKKYAGVVDHLLKSFIVVDNIDNALHLAARFDHSLRIVTLEGEQLAPGGSIAGGAFRNAGNLLGRKRELQQLEEQLSRLEKEIGEIRDAQGRISSDKKRIRDDMDRVRATIQQYYVDQNSIKLNLEKERQRVNEIIGKAKSYEEENSQIESRTMEYEALIKRQQDKLQDNGGEQERLNALIDSCNGKLLELRFGEGAALEKVNKLQLEAANIEQAGQYTDENIRRINADIERLKGEEQEIRNSRSTSGRDAEAKQAEIDEHRSLIERDTAKSAELDKEIKELQNKKETLNREHKSFFESWSELGKRVTELEKEVLRLSQQKERLSEQLDAQISYIWDEYELTVSAAEDYRDPNFKISTSRKDINDTKSQIKALGDVNVNAIEEYKSVSERYKLLSSQRDDLLTSKESITRIIDELDDAMRKQFSDQFTKIGHEFNNVFRELFGGGKGELELVEDEDMLEAGIRIIAQPPGKKLQNMMQLSGGEKALTAIALLFAIQNLKPSPFCLLDEIEAALDDSNVKRFANYLRKLTKNSQFIVITHRRGTMSSADILYGITMQEKGVSTLVSVSLIEANLDN